MKILYIGVGKHFDVIKHFTECNEFVFIDSKPLNEYGYYYYHRSFYSPAFVKTIVDELKELGFILQEKKVLTDNFTEINKEDLECTKMIFSNDNKKIIYYISTSIPYHLDIKELQEDIGKCNTLLISGHHPAYQVLNYLETPFLFIGYKDTWYPLNNNDSYTSMEAIIKNPKIVKQYILVDNITGSRTIFETYQDFYNGKKEDLY